MDADAYRNLRAELDKAGVTLVAVSKTKPVEDIQALYDLGQRDFGENYVQELTAKAVLLPPDIRWHFIGHLQTNKVKHIIPFVQLIQGVDSLKLLDEIDKQAGKAGRKVDCLLQVHIADEETKFGFGPDELGGIIREGREHVRIRGLMGMATLTGSEEKIRSEFRQLGLLFTKYRSAFSSPQLLSMGMSSDYKIAIEEKTNMVRIGSILFGTR
jgi:PLP dependent protein